jgi:hypothetical protein
MLSLHLEVSDLDARASHLTMPPRGSSWRDC